MSSSIEHAARPASPPPWRIIIAGGGAPGLSLGLALRQALGQAVRVTIYDPGFAHARSDGRAFAVSPAARSMLGALGVWAEIRPHPQAILGMRITDSRIEDPIRPDYLSFSGEDEPLGHMVEAEQLGEVLRRRCRAAGVELEAHSLIGFTVSDQAVTARREDGASEIGALLVAADGARSRLRDEAGIAWLGRSYGQSGIVATIALIPLTGFVYAQESAVNHSSACDCT